ncbi:MAG: metallophosphoesterase [Methanocalculaceae archaeon]|jgi:metallophosphoesterase superfamily enzyme|nr:metallophosphoesterase [Methanocalculaceae archaeon]
MNPKFYPDGPAVLIERHERILVLADPHFGVEADLYHHGLHIQSGTASRLSRLLIIIEESKPDYLVILGDFKHMIPYVTSQEKNEIPQVLKKIRDLTQFRLAIGNHDAGIEKYLLKDEQLPTNGAVIDGCGYMHGHAIPAHELSGKLILCGHHHPVVNIYDEVGCSLHKIPCYLLAEIDGTVVDLPKTTAATRVLLVPAFCEFSGGFDVRMIPGKKISPLAGAIRTDTLEVFLKDGTYVNTWNGLIPNR